MNQLALFPAELNNAYPMAIIGTRALDGVRGISGPYADAHRAELAALYVTGQWSALTVRCYLLGVDPREALASLAQAYPATAPALEPHYALCGAGWQVVSTSAYAFRPVTWRMPDGAEVSLLDEAAVARAVVAQSGLSFRELQSRAVPQRSPLWRVANEEPS